MVKVLWHKYIDQQLYSNISSLAAKGNQLNSPNNDETFYSDHNVFGSSLFCFILKQPCRQEPLFSLFLVPRLSTETVGNLLRITQTI